MKSFRQLYSEVAEPKPEEEKKFKAQHTVDVIDHPVSTEFQHKGVAKPKAKRKADQEGDTNYDKAYVVKEETEELDEISKKTLGSYASKSLQRGDIAARMSKSDSDSMGKIANKRLTGVKKAVDRIAPKADATRIKKNIDKSKEAARNRYTDKDDEGKAYYAAQKGISKVREEVEQLDELSPNTLHSYVKKSAGNMAGNAAVAAAQASSSKGKSTPDVKRKIANRMRGITGASGRLADKANMAEDASEEKPMMSKQLDFIAYAAKEIKDYIAKTPDPEEWYQNKLTAAHEAMKTLHANIGDHEADDMDESLEEGLIGGILGGAAGMMAGTATGASSAASNFAGNLAAKAGKNMIQRGAYRAIGNAAGAAAPALAGAVVGSKAQDAITGKKKNEELVGGQKKLDHNKNGKIDAHDFKVMKSKKMKEEVEQIDEAEFKKWVVTIKKGVNKLKKGQHATVTARNTAEAIKKAIKQMGEDPRLVGGGYVDVALAEDVQLDEISQETLRNYHGAAALDLRKKREKLAKGTLTTKDHKQGQNRATGLNRAADKMHEESEILDEAFSQGILKFKDRSQMIIKKEDADALNKMFKGMSSTNKKKMTEDAMATKKSFEEILGFAREA